MKNSIVRAAACAALALAAAGPAHAAGLYKCKTVGGRVVIGDRPCTQDSLGRENLKLATPQPQAALPPQRSPHDATFSRSGPQDRKVMTADEPAAPAPPAHARPSGIKREEQAEQQSGIDSK